MQEGQDSKPKSDRNLSVSVREAHEDGELNSAAYLRAVSFYAYPPERAFAGQIHQQQMWKEELFLLKRQRNRRKAGGFNPGEESATLVAMCPQSQVPEIDEWLQISRGDGEEEAVIGSLDLHAVKAMTGEVLIGNSSHAAYLANVCVSDEAKRQGVGAAMIHTARQICREWGADALFVHLMAVNEIGRRFYGSQGFVVEQEESSNEAHHRGRCLDGIEGRGRTILMRDTL